MPKVHKTGPGRTKKKVGWRTWTRTTGIYRIKNLITDERYIGLSKDLGQRWKQHLYQLEAGIHHNTPLQESWNEHGITNFAFEVCEVCYKKDLARKETEWWDKEKAQGFSLFNGRPNGNYPEHTTASKRKISKALKGKTKSKEHKQKISQSLMGVNKGKILSEEHKQKVSESKKGSKNPMFGTTRSKETLAKFSKRVIQMDLEGNIIQEWFSASVVKRELGIDPGSIGKCCQGKRKTAGGFKWRYA
jgi:group I intron endonuclease